MRFLLLLVLFIAASLPNAFVLAKEKNKAGLTASSKEIGRFLKKELPEIAEGIMLMMEMKSAYDRDANVRSYGTARVSIQSCDKGCSASLGLGAYGVVTTDPKCWLCVEECCLIDSVILAAPGKPEKTCGPRSCPVPDGGTFICDTSQCKFPKKIQGALLDAYKLKKKQEKKDRL